MKTFAEITDSVVQRLPAPLGFALFVARRLRDGRCLEAAGSLTFTTLLAFVPFLAIAVSVLSAFPIFEQFSNQFKIFLLTNLVPDSAGKIISVYMRQFADNADRLTAMGTLSLVVTALAMMFTIDTTFNRVWRVRKQRPWLVKTLIYWAVLTLGPLILGISLTLTSWLAAQGASADSHGFIRAVLGSSSFFLSLAAFALLYRVVPNCPVPNRHAAVAALCAALAFEWMKTLFGWYIKQFGTFKLVYGAFASFPIFLLWLYITWVIVLGGAVISAALSYWRGGAWRRVPHPGQRLHDAVHLLLALEQARLNGEIMKLSTLRRQLSLGQDELHELLERLAEKGWVQATRNEGWLLAIALDRILLKDLYHLLVTCPVVASSRDNTLDGVLDHYFKSVDASLDVSLAHLAQSLPPTGQLRLAAPVTAAP